MGSQSGTCRNDSEAFLMAGTLIAVRIAEPEAEEARAGGPARYALYAAAAVAALTGAWLVAAPASQSGPTSAPAPIASMAMTRAVDAVRQIDMTASNTHIAAEAPAVYTAPAVASAAKAETSVADTTAVAETKLPPLPQRRPAVPQTVASAQPVATTAKPVVQAEPAPQALGEPPQVWTMVEPAEPVYAPAQPIQQPAYDTAAATVDDGPVPPLPVEPGAAGAEQDGLLARSERVVGSAWNWSTGTVTGIVREVRSRTF